MTHHRQVFAAILAMSLAVGSDAQTRKVDVFVKGTGLHAIHGITFDAQDRLYVGSVVGQSIYRIDIATGKHEVVVGPTDGLADDLEFSRDGVLTWTSIVQGAVRSRGADGSVRTLAQGIPGANSMAFNAEGRLFATEVFLGDALYEIDTKGEKPPRKILENMGGLNGFDFGPDGFLYGPIWFKGQVAKVNVETGELSVVAEGLGIPAAANFDSKGNLHVLDSQRGEILRIDTKTGAKTVISKFQSAMDNLAFDSKDNLYVTVMSESAVYRIDTKTGASTEIRRDPLAIPADLAIWTDGDAETIYLADTFAIRAIDAKSAKVSDFARFVETELEYPAGIDVSDRFVHTTSWFGNVVQTFDRKTRGLVRTLHEFQVPFDVLELPDGDLLVAQVGAGDLVRVDSAGEKKVVVSGLTTPVSLARGADGSVLVSEYAKGDVVSVNLATGDKRVVVEGLAQPEGIAIGNDGRLLVVEVGTKSIVAIDLKTGSRETLAGDLQTGLQMSRGMPPMGAAAGIACAADGTMYVSADLTDSIQRVSAR